MAVQVGLDNAGKTTALYRLSLGQTVATAPTIGSNVEQVQLGNLSFELWDLGGQANQRSAWSRYFNNVDAIIVVLDSSDRERIPIAKQELYQILATKDLEKVPLLVLANKQVRLSFPDGPWPASCCESTCMVYPTVDITSECGFSTIFQDSTYV
jgi:small GTP-binding protein